MFLHNIIQPSKQEKQKRFHNDKGDIADKSTYEAKPDINQFIVHGDMDFKVNGHSYVMRGITVSGVEEQELHTNGYGFFDGTNCYGKEPSVVFISVDKSFRWFKMPYEDVTFTISWVPAGGTDAEILSAKESAKSAIQSTYDGYISRNNYTQENQAALTQAKDAGIAAVDAASTLDGVNTAWRNALSAMASIPKDVPVTPGVTLPDMGTQVGEVYISVENTTYLDGTLNTAFKGTILSGWYNLCQRDSMMTVVLKALASADYSWAGDGSGYDISYISSISKDMNGDGTIDKTSEQLGEFSGAQGSGWMGTLNDFFTNEGFGAFSVANGKLGTGDEIRIMFTQNLGEDIGGSWGNSDTSLKDLRITGATLAPVFNSSILDYDLIIPSSRVSIVITPTAANKNYLVKTFLNEYDTDRAFYKRTDTISVTRGNTVYVGCGEYHWPSMNNQGAEARPYTGTKYTLHVYTAGVDGLQARINALPDLGKLTLANYASYGPAVTQLREDCRAAGAPDSIDDTRLTALENRIKFFRDIEDVILNFN